MLNIFKQGVFILSIFMLYLLTLGPESANSAYVKKQLR
ncbi:exported protein of unknown function [Xenorhabdus doucetiae]|uniref:Uncharacterized protein n=1 Tax=Xenorhabdus doucetiae TaxID=351671 RepID=A0A068QMC9_9GAMM|nr:exported protein of unknown function [Xenorhabdus doucetiae]